MILDTSDTQVLNVPSDLPPHYINGVFGTVYLFVLDNTKG